MKFTSYEVIGIAASIAIMATALWLANLSSTNTTLTQQANQQAAVVVGTTNDQVVGLADALVEAGAADGTPERLVVDDVVIGTGPAVVSGDTVSVHYIGSLPNGVQFDNSYLRGQTFSFTVGDGRVIAGWEQGLLGMQVGGQRVLVIPPELGYGAAGGGPIPPNSTLVFAIELVSINE